MRCLAKTALMPSAGTMQFLGRDYLIGRFVAIDSRR
jgi:hypothetical protein